MNHCDICKEQLNGNYVDGKTIYGYWATLCESCHKKIGIGFGPGKGQLFDNTGTKIVLPKHFKP